MPAAGQPGERSRRLRVGVLQLFDLVRVQLRLHVDRGHGAEVREEQGLDRSRATLQR